MEKKWRFQCWSSEVVEFRITLWDFQESIKNGRKWLVNQFCYLLKSKFGKKNERKIYFSSVLFFFHRFFSSFTEWKKAIEPILESLNLHFSIRWGGWLLHPSSITAADPTTTPTTSHSPNVSLMVHCYDEMQQNEGDKLLNCNRLLHLFQA